MVTLFLVRHFGTGCFAGHLGHVGWDFVGVSGFLAFFS